MICTMHDIMSLFFEDCFGPICGSKDENMDDRDEIIELRDYLAPINMIKNKNVIISGDVTLIQL